MSINKRRAAEDLNPVFYFFLISGSIVKDCLTREGITHLPLLYRRLEHQNQSVNINWLLACRDRRALFNFTIDFIDKAYSPASAGTHKRQFGRIYNVLPPFITVIVFEDSSALFKAACLLLFVAFPPSFVFYISSIPALSRGAMPLIPLPPPETPGSFIFVFARLLSPLPISPQPRFDLHSSPGRQ